MTPLPSLLCDFFVLRLKECYPGMQDMQNTPVFPDPGSVEFYESRIGLVIAYDRMAVADERVEHHRRVHQGVVRAPAAAYCVQRLFLRRGRDTFPYDNSCTMPAVRAPAGNRNGAVCAPNGNPALFLVPDKFEGFHGSGFFRWGYQDYDAGSRYYSYCIVQGNFSRKPVEFI